jgi:hypothetical protein
MEADQFGHDFWWPWGSERQSSIRELELTKSGISATYLTHILAPMSSLRALRHHHTSFGGGAGYEWDGGAFLLAIRDSSAGDTLEELSLTISS